MRLLIPEGRAQTARYLIGGGTCALANNALLITGAQAGLGILALTLLSFLAVGTAGYITHVHFTFRQAPSWRGYARFMAGVALGIPAAYAILALLCDMLHVPMWVAAPIATVTLFIYNYLSARLAITRRLFG